MSTNKSFSSETSERYSRALFEVVKESNEIEKAEKDIKNFLLILNKSIEIDNFIKDPSKITTIIAPENMSAFNLGPYVEHNTRAEEVDMEEVTAS